MHRPPDVTAFAVRVSWRNWFGESEPDVQLTPPPPPPPPPAAGGPGVAVGTALPAAEPDGPGAPNADGSALVSVASDDWPEADEDADGEHAASRSNPAMIQDRDLIGLR
jgi:hypothetical protein